MSLLSLRQRRTAWLFALLVVVLTALVGHRVAASYLASQEAVHRTLAVRGAISDTLSLLKDAETGQRGYLLSGNVEFLAPRETAAREIPGQLARLRELTGEDVEQSRAAAELERLSLERLSLIDTTIELSRQGDNDSAVEIVREGRGNRIMQELRAEADRMLGHEAARLRAREDALEADQLKALFALGVGVALMLAMVLGGLATARKDVSELQAANDKLHASEQALKHLAENAVDLIRIIDTDSRIVYCSSSSISLLGYEASEMYAKEPRSLVHPDERELARLLTERVRSNPGPAESLVHRLRHKDGSYRWFETRVHVPEGGESQGRLYLNSRDIHARKLAEDAARLAEKELVENEQRFRILSDSSFEGVAISKAGRVVDVNANFASWLGRDRAELIGMEGVQLFVPEDRELVACASTIEPLYEGRMLRSDGTIFHVEVRGRQALLHGEVVRIAVVRDISDRKRREADAAERAEALRVISMRDELTGLYNRRGFYEQARRELRTLDKKGRSACLLFADLNGLKTINDELGHEAGDRAIASAGRILRSIFRDSDVVARLGGDELAVFALDCGAGDVATIRARMKEAIGTFNRDSGERFVLSVSLGAAVYDPAAPIELDRLVEMADARMYDEKRRVGSRSSVTPRGTTARGARSVAGNRRSVDASRG